MRLHWEVPMDETSSESEEDSVRKKRRTRQRPLSRLRRNRMTGFGNFKPNAL